MQGVLLDGKRSDSLAGKKRLTRDPPRFVGRQPLSQALGSGPIALCMALGARTGEKVYNEWNKKKPRDLRYARTSPESPSRTLGQSTPLDQRQRRWVPVALPRHRPSEPHR